MAGNIVDALMNSIANAAFGDYDPNMPQYQGIKGRSIKTRTQDLIMQFPLLISENIDIKTAAKLAEGFEAENAILVKLLLQNDLGALSKGKNVGSTSQVIRQIHTNINADPLLECKKIEAENLKQLVPIDDKFNNFSLNEATLPKYLKEDEVTNIRFSKDNFFDNKVYEKINKISPTFIEMDYNLAIRGDSGILDTGHAENKETQCVKIIFGVKCVVHPLKSDDIIHNINSTFTNSTLFKLVKWTTGEYSFMQGVGEVIFDYSRMKELGIQASKTSNYWWFKLKKLKNANKAKHFIGSNKVRPTKTATLLITKDEVDTISREYNIDLTQTKVAYKLLNDLFLLNFGYVDESIERVYLFDELSKTYIVKEFSDFERKKKPDPINVDDIKSLFGR